MPPQRLFFVIAALFFSFFLAECQRVAVVGAGIGGSSTSYYLRKWLPGSSVTVFDRNNYIGGRLKHVVLDGVTVEVGGDAWSEVNPYMVELASELGVSFDNSSYTGNGRVGLWDGERWYEMSSDWVGEAELLGLMDLLRFNLWLNYRERGTGGVESTAFHSIGEFIRYGSLDGWALLSCNDLVKKYSIDRDFVWRNWAPLSRVIYDQGLNVNTFAGMVVLLSAFTASYSVEGGNSLLVEKLLAKANAKVLLNTEVTRIARKGNDYTVTTVPVGNSSSSGEQEQEQEQTFERVVLAAPIEFAYVKFVNISLPPITNRKYYFWFVTHVVAKSINPTYFKLPPSDQTPSFVLTPDNSTAPFNSISTQNLGSDGNVIFKIFGNVNLTASTLEKMFVGMVSFHVQHWPYTFPDLSPVETPSQYQPVLLDGSGSLLYLNSMESVATAMEASAIAGRNAALIIAHSLVQQ